MAKFGYTTINRMEPRPGRRYATEYYKQSRQERLRLQEYIERTIQMVGETALEDPVMAEGLFEPIPEHRRQDHAGHYTAYDIMKDIIDQIDAGKDVPRSMVNRWNKIFTEAGRGIDMVPESQLPAANQFQAIFQ